ncbi:glutathione S-transferase N-terminal domain-containing protein [Pararhizobium sp.]|uniref:glutathione S-transferase N-terminal domain-containing protein n=1 Tax=Pararhizobium sp. TaxID=1977563 RepID=UPI0027220688|nr:glutathione S-transferase N-terminal domain-containing protein [Pararhizobium sp.]MDO9414552.1 glutathione S-transferase N-terminal domain-containing protein [Pararhizobium sp.]
MPRDTYVLRSTLTSPFGRKVRMAIDVLGLSDLIKIIPADTLDETDTLRLQNPLGKLPCLLLADGTALYDSVVIVEFLQEIAGTDALLPRNGLERYKTLTATTLADGITDAALLLVYEGRFRDEGTYSERWLKHQRGKITRALATLEAAPPDPKQTDIASIALGCAFGYLDWRKPFEWRAAHPRLVQWLEAFTAHEPAYARTAIPSA